MAIIRKTNKSGIAFDPAQNSLLFAEDWNNMGDQVENLLGRTYNMTMGFNTTLGKTLYAKFSVLIKEK